jgi:hypothetical protein
LYCGADKSTDDMLTIPGMMLDAEQNPVTGTKSLTINIYSSYTATTPLYTENFPEVQVKNGYFSIAPGMTSDVASVVRNSKNLFYDILSDGVSIYNGSYKPLTASPYTIKNSFALHGEGSPLIEGLEAPPGASYVDTQNQELYMKVGPGEVDWIKVGF